ncbi:MAG: DUF4410 domain-containing protein [Flavobacteriaceae bacterium]|nr:DUF4410 domain-containing protein [Flavobacteriaceae bacterium]MDG2315058.1 DUF4410 domain-containing protein [Flavobacteriaceae bacterium]
MALLAHCLHQTKKLNLSQYEYLVVEKVVDKTKKKNTPDYFLEKFQDKLVSSLKQKNIFISVDKELKDSIYLDKTLLLRAGVTRYSEGNPALKMLVGFGAGSSYLDALVFLVNAKNNSIIGNIKIDKNSWALGGAIAASQSVDTFLDGSCKKIASEIEKAKTGISN